MRSWIVCVGVAWAGAAQGAPKPAAPKPAAPRPAAPKPAVPKPAPKITAAAQYKAAAAQYGSGNYDQALALIAAGLEIAPKDFPLLRLRATMLLEQRNYTDALAAYEALLEAGVKGRERVQAEEIVKKLRAVRSTFLDIAFTNGPAAVYLDSKSLGAFCPAAAAATCHRAVLPNQYTVIVERPGFERWSDRVTIESGETKQLSVTLIEKPSALTVQIEPPGAQVTVDGQPYDAARPVPAGRHQVVASLDRYHKEQREVVAHEGQPIALELALVPLVPVRVEPAEAALLLDGKPAAPEAGALALPAGAHELVARAPGFHDRRIQIPAERGADYQLVVALERVVIVKAPPAPSRFTGRRKIAVAAGAAGLAALGAGVALGLQARGLDDDAYALCPSPAEPCAGAAEATDLNDRARSRALTANVAYGIAGGAVIAAAVLWLTGAPERRPAAPQPRVALTPRLGAGAGLDLSVRF